MAYQTTIDTEYDPDVRSGMRENLAGLAHDALTLAELQVQLLSVDLRDAKRGAGPALAQLIIGTVLALGSIPILLAASALALTTSLNWPPYAAYSAVGLVAVVVAALLLHSGWQRTVQAFATVRRSRTEFTETLQWLKSSLRGGGRAAPDHARSDSVHHRLNQT